MSQCIFCGNAGLKVSVDEHGLCSKCAEEIKLMVDTNMKTIRAANQQMHDSSVDIKTQIKDCDIIIDSLEKLHTLEVRGVQHIMNQPADVLLQEIIKTRQNFVNTIYKKHHDNIFAAYEKENLWEKKLAIADEAIQYIEKLIIEAGYNKAAEKCRNDYRKLSYQAEFKVNIALAELAEKNENLEEAVELYEQALMYLSKLEKDPDVHSQNYIHLQNKIELIKVMVENAKPRRDY